MDTPPCSGLIKERLEEALELFECELLDAAEYADIKRQLVAELLDVNGSGGGGAGSSAPPEAAEQCDEEDEDEDDAAALEVRLRAVYDAFAARGVVRRRSLVDLCFAADRSILLVPGSEGVRGEDRLGFGAFAAFFDARSDASARSEGCSVHHAAEAAMLRAVLLTRRWAHLFQLDEYDAAEAKGAGSTGSGTRKRGQRDPCSEARAALVVDGGGDAMRVTLALGHDAARRAEPTTLTVRLTLQAAASEADVHETLGALDVALSAATASWPLGISDASAALSTARVAARDEGSAVEGEGERCIVLRMRVGRDFDPSVAVGAAASALRSATLSLSSRTPLADLMGAASNGAGSGAGGGGCESGAPPPTLLSLLGGALHGEAKWDARFVHFLLEACARTKASEWRDALEEGRTARSLAPLATAQRARAACIAALTSLATVEAVALDYSTRSVVDAASFLRLALRQAAPFLSSSAAQSRSHSGGDDAERSGGTDGEGEAQSAVLATLYSLLGDDAFWTMTPAQLRALWHTKLGALVDVARAQARSYAGADGARRALAALLGEAATRALRGVASVACECAEGTLALHATHLDIFSVFLPPSFDRAEGAASD
jgi:hypothetical protein